MFKSVREQRRGPNPEEVAILFNLVGQSVWYLQHLEDALSTSIAMKRDIKMRGSVSEAKMHEILRKHRRRTLGDSVNVAKKAKIYAENIQNRLDDFLKERNWLIHRLIHENGDDMNLNDKREKLFLRVEMFVDEAKNLQKEIGEDLINFAASQGVSPAWVEAYAQEQFDKSRGREAVQD